MRSVRFMLGSRRTPLVYLLPSNGGVGVGRTLQLVIAPLLGRPSFPQASTVTGGSYRVRWASSNITIASVDQGGKVKGVAAGQVTITAKVTGAGISGSLALTCKVKVGVAVR